MENAFGMFPGFEPDEWSNDACRGYVIAAAMSSWQWRTAAFQRRIFVVLWDSFMKSLISTVWRTPNRSSTPVRTDLGPHRPEVEKAQRAAPAGAVF